VRLVLRLFALVALVLCLAGAGTYLFLWQSLPETEGEISVAGLGATALDTDRFMCTLGLRRVAEANLRHYGPETRRLLDAYAAGVNAFLAGIQRLVLTPRK
jgi:hypothetical protein